MVTAQNLFPVRDAERDKAFDYLVRAKKAGQSTALVHRAMGGLYALITLRRWWVEHQKYEASLPPPMPSSTVGGNFGERGSGKTLLAVHMAMGFAALGRPIIYNPRRLELEERFPRRKGWSVPKYMSWKDMALMDDGLTGAFIILDEAQMPLSKYRASATGTLLLMGLLQQTRKIGADVWVTSNSPNSITPDFSYQLNIHGNCKGYMRPDHEADSVWVQWVDTARRYGRGTPRMARGRFIDDNIRAPQYLWPASAVWPYFNTGGMADPLDMMGLRPEDMIIARAEQKAGLSLNQLATWILGDLVPRLVNEKHATSLRPLQVLAWVADPHGGNYIKSYDHTTCCGHMGPEAEGIDGCQDGSPILLQLEPEMFTEACRLAGLSPRKRGGVISFPLPPPELLKRWQEGLWAPQDEL